jgi:ABC transporter substrate binding protein (PQQ-dependent alcohol dehydrogenase system)
MTERDYAAWVAVRTIGEALTRIKTDEVSKVRAFVMSPDFAISAFMGTGASYRPWDHQLRQQILLTGPRMLVSFSPQQGFLHEFDTLDTLGFDRPDSTCKLAK